MPRVVPSDVVRAIDQMFTSMIQEPTSSPQVDADSVPLIRAVVNLVEAVPDELLVLNPDKYAGLIASIGFLSALPDKFQARRGSDVARMNMAGFGRNPMALIRDAMADCPDEAPTDDTPSLSFITDAALRDSIRLDVSGANRDLAIGEWKGATVLAGSALEALLLWALRQRRANDIARARETVTADGRLPRNPGADLERWLLPDYVEVAGELKILKPDTVQAARLAKNSRNLIHPGRAIRLGQNCDKGTALSGLAAVERVVQDLTEEGILKQL
jgi:hypothetical protein